MECGVDMYGKPRTCNKLECIVRGNLQVTSSAESRYPFGTSKLNTHRLYLNPDVKIKNNNILKIEGYTGFFKVNGNPMVYDNLIPHIMVSLIHKKKCIGEDYE